MQPAPVRDHDPPRLLELDGLRGCAILAVFCSHVLAIRMLWMGVDLFFVLSGFLITGILLDLKQKDLRHFFADFYRCRARRILPPYVLLLIVVTLWLGTPWARHWYMLLGAMNYVKAFHEPQFLPLVPLWSLGVEEQFYLVWPLAVYFVARRRLRWVLVAMLLAAPVLRGLAAPYDTRHWFVYMGTPFRMDTLAAGSLLTLVWRRYREPIRRFGFLGLIPLTLTPAIMLVLNRFGGFSTMDGTVHGDVVTYEVALAGVVGAVLWALGGRFTSILRTAPLRWMGRISYSFYLIHYTVMLFWETRVDSDRRVAVLTFVVSAAYATLTWFLVERPVLARGRNRRLEQAAATSTEIPAAPL